MKKTTTTIFGAALLAACTASQAAVVTDGLIGEYTFDGQNANDSTGIIGNGTATGTPTYSTAGGSDFFLNLSPGNFITIADDADIPSGADARTVSLWVMVTDNQDSAGPFRSGENANGKDFSIETTGNNSEMRFNGWNADQTFSVAPGSVATWTNIAVTYDGTTLTSYVDGAAVDSSAFTLNSGSNGIKFGGTRITRSDGDNGSFSIDDVLIYDRALTASEVAQNIPEPSVALLGGLGLLGLIRRRRA